MGLRTGVSSWFLVGGTSFLTLNPIMIVPGPGAKYVFLFFGPSFRCWAPFYYLCKVERLNQNPLLGIVDAQTLNCHGVGTTFLRLLTNLHLFGDICENKRRHKDQSLYPWVSLGTYGQCGNAFLTWGCYVVCYVVMGFGYQARRYGA